MTDMLIDGIITKDAYEEKMNELIRKLHELNSKKQFFDECISREKDVSKRMALLRESLKREEVLDEFDREVFDCIVDRVIVGGYEEDGTPDPYKLTFVLKGNQQGTIPNSKQHHKKQKSKAERSVS